MRFLVLLAIGVIIGSQPALADTERSIGSKLDVLFQPVEDGSQGERKATQIARCSAKVAVSDWSKPEAARLEAELTNFTRSLNTISPEMLAAVKAGKSVEEVTRLRRDAAISPALRAQLDKLAPAIAQCTRRIGGGVTY